jgi:hypothetical protein
MTSESERAIHEREQEVELARFGSRGPLPYVILCDGIEASVPCFSHSRGHP